MKSHPVVQWALAFCLALVLGQAKGRSDAGSIADVLAAADAEIAALPGEEANQVAASSSVGGIAALQAEHSDRQGKTSEILPEKFDAISFLAETEAAEELATATEEEALQAEAQEARSRAWLWRARARQNQGLDSDSAAAGVRVAEHSVAKKSQLAEELMTKARSARQAVLQLTDKVAPHLGGSHVLSSFGPSDCVQLWRDRTSGNCFLRSQCSNVAGFEFYEVGFRCANDEELQEHRYGVGSFASSELQDTQVKCQQCLPPTEKPLESLAQELKALRTSLSAISSNITKLQSDASHLRR